MANAVLFVCGPAGSLTARPRLSARRAPRVQRDRERERERERERALAPACVREGGTEGELACRFLPGFSQKRNHNNCRCSIVRKRGNASREWQDWQASGWTGKGLRLRKKRE